MSLFLCFIIVNVVFPPLLSLVIPWYSRVKDVCRCIWSWWQRCPANPAVLLASGHGGDQKPDFGTLPPLRQKPHSHTNLGLLFNIFIWYQKCKNFFCALFCLPNAKPVHFFQKDFRVQELPLARIKKIMKLDEDVKVGGLSKLHLEFTWLTMIMWMPYGLTDDVL